MTTPPNPSMQPATRNLSFRALGTSDTHLRYLEDDPDLNDLLGRQPRNAAELLSNAPLDGKRLVEPGALAQALEAYAVRHDAPQPVIDNARSVADGNTYMVVTGQQPGLFGGPLYTIHKAATAIRLARELSAEPGAPRVVPIFWNHSDDHDFDEVNRAFLVNPNQDLQRVRLDLPHAGEAIRDIEVGAALEHALAAAGDLLPNSDFREWALSLFAPKNASEQLGDSLARLLFGMFGHHGLLVIEPRDLPATAFDVLPEWFARADDIRDRTREVTEHLTDLGIDVTLDPTTTMMFELGERRQALTDGDPVRSPTDLSPGVLLRPLWQDACLPTIGFVVGPGELSYLAVVASLYKMLDVPRPAFVSRASLTLVEPSMAKFLDRFEWDIPDLTPGADVLSKDYESDDEHEVEAELGELAELIGSKLGAPTVAKLKQLDAPMVGPLERGRAKLLQELEKVRTKLRNSRRNRQGNGARQIRRLCNNLRPRGRAQERVLGVLPFLVSHGIELSDVIVDAADPFAQQHGVVEL